MKYRDPKTGEVFEDIEKALQNYCDRHSCSCGCSINSVVPGSTADLCVAWCDAHPAVAAHLMGLEIITDQEEPMEKKEKPRICEVLGGKDSPLEVGEVFTIRDYPNRGDWYAVVHTDGKLHNYLAEPCQTTGTRIGNKIGTNTLYWLLEHPEAILRMPRFTQEDTADAAAILRWYPTASVASRGAAGHLIVGDKERVVLVVFKPEVRVLPSLRPRQALRLEDVLEGEA